MPGLSELNDNAALLDKYYIPTRYPNGLPDLTPGQVYTKSDAALGLAATNRFIELLNAGWKPSRVMAYVAGVPLIIILAPDAKTGRTEPDVITAPSSRAQIELH